MDKYFANKPPESKRRIIQRHRRALSTSDRQKIRQKLIKKKGRRCALCGRQGLELTLDHIIPLSKGGNNRIANLQLACHECNSRKGNDIL